MRTVNPYGHLLFWVGSRSRKNLRHLVDLEATTYTMVSEDGKTSEVLFPYICECEAFFYHGHRPCYHVLCCLAWLALHNAETMRAYLASELDLDLLKELAIEEFDDPDYETRLTNQTVTESPPKLPKRRYRLDPGTRLKRSA